MSIYVSTLKSILAEREKLFDEVETEWAKRESRTLQKVQQKVNNQTSNASDSDSESDNEAEECIVKGRNMALNGFYRIARNTMSMWFRSPEPPAQEVSKKRFLFCNIYNQSKINNNSLFYCT